MFRRAGIVPVRWLGVLAGFVALLVAGAVVVARGADDRVAVAPTVTLFAAAAMPMVGTTSTTSTTTTSTTSTTTSSTTTSTTSTTTSTTAPPTTTVAPTTTVLGPNGRVVGAVLSDPQDAGERFAVAVAGRAAGDDVVSPGSPADVYQRWVRSVPGGGDAIVTGTGYAVTVDRPVELGGFVVDDEGRVSDFAECVDGECRAVSSLVIWPEMCGRYTCGTVFSSTARFPVWLVATLYVRPETPIQVFELRSDEPVATVDDAGGVVWFDPGRQRLVITLPRHPAPGTQTVIAMTMGSGGREFAAVVYGD